MHLRVIAHEKKWEDSITNMTIKVFNVWHNKIFDDLVQIPQSQYDRLVWFGVNERYDKDYNRDKGYQIMFEYELPMYRPELQQKWYCQTSCMYHCYKNRLYEGVEYVGFLQYDCRIRNDFFDDMENQLKTLSKEVPIFYMHLLSLEETLRWCSGLCDDHPNAALTHYNAFFNTNYTSHDIIAANAYLPYNHVFVIPSTMFDRMMRWICEYIDVIESTPEAWPSTFSRPEFLERCHGLFLAIEQVSNPDIKLVPLSVEHDQSYKKLTIDRGLTSIAYH